MYKSSRIAPSQWSISDDYSHCNAIDLLKESPCKTCRHRNEDKNECVTYKHCPLHIPTVLAGSERSYATKSRQPSKDKRPKKQCPVPGCTNMVYLETRVCQKCWPRTNHRIRKGVPEHILYENFKLPNNWKEIYGTQKYERKNRL